MSNYVQLGDVHTYYEEDGAGEPLVLLHPGLADSRAFEDYVPESAQHFHVFRPDRRGHGRTPDVQGPITYALMAQDTIAFLEQVVGGPASLLGHSDGAPVALLAALERPDLVRKLVLSAGVFHHHGWAPGAIDLDDETTAFSPTTGAPSPRRTRSLPDREGQAGPDAPRGAHPHRRRPRRLLRAGAGHGRRQRREIPINHTLALHRGLPNAQLAVLPGTGHGGIDARIVIDFLTKRAEEA
jgi:pimeloyl-ACP methyl ester carboxylesterase